MFLCLQKAFVFNNCVLNSVEPFRLSLHITDHIYPSDCQTKTHNGSISVLLLQGQWASLLP